MGHIFPWLLKDIEYSIENMIINWGICLNDSINIANIFPIYNYGIKISVGDPAPFFHWLRRKRRNLPNKEEKHLPIKS
jgi:hypothetical protein